MGYSLSVRARTEALAVRMEQFFEREYRPFQQIWGLDDGEQYSSVPSRDFSYHAVTDSPKLIGIDYKAAGHERLYVFTLVHWMALKVGQRRTTFNEPKITFEKPVPYMFYDVDGPWPVLDQPLSKTPKSVRWCCVDSFGIVRKPPSDLEHEVDRAIWEKAHAESMAKHGQPSPETHETRMAILAPEVWKLVEPLRVEMKRLEACWQDFR